MQNLVPKKSKYGKSTFYDNESVSKSTMSVAKKSIDFKKLSKDKTPYTRTSLERMYDSKIDPLTKKLFE